MDALWLLSRLILAAVFAVAGVGKLLDLKGSIAAVRGFGVPERPARLIGVALPFLEILAALLLLPVSTALAGAILAVALLTIFIGGMANSLRKGETPDCHCFGQLHSEPVSVRTIARNVTLAALGVFILFGGGTPGASLVGWLNDETTVVQVLVVGLGILLLAAVAQAWLVVHLLGQNGRLLIRMDEIEKKQEAAPLPAAVPAPAPASAKVAPEFSATGLIGEKVTLELLRSPGKPVLLIFSDPKCGPCQTLNPEIAAWQRDHVDRLTVAVITRGSIEDARAKAKPHGLTRVAIEQDRAVSNLYGVPGTPAAVLIDRNGRFGSEVVAGADAIRALVKTASTAPATNGSHQQPAPVRSRVGETAPAFTLPDAAGGEVHVDQLAGQDSLLVFWNPGCGFCKRLQPDLITWSDQKPEGAPRVVAVTSGTSEAAAEMTFADRVLLDQQFATGRLYGASGTPSAVLVGADGTIASDLAVGGPAIMTLLSERRTRAGANS